MKKSLTPTVRILRPAGKKEAKKKDRKKDVLPGGGFNPYNSG